MRKPGGPRGKSVPLVSVNGLKEKYHRLKSVSFTSKNILPDLPGSDISEYQTKMDMQKAQLNEQKKIMEKMQERMNMQFQLQSQAALLEETETDERYIYIHIYIYIYICIYHILITQLSIQFIAIIVYIYTYIGLIHQ
jgi:hypothetical protein